VRDGCFLAIGVVLSPGCVIGAGSEVGIRAVAQVDNVLPPETRVPIG
jgi:carbonic anhydrase/acetyltransferase-like protein (isoleucine patch superfamily)